MAALLGWSCLSIRARKGGRCQSWKGCRGAPGQGGARGGGVLTGQGLDESGIDVSVIMAILYGG
jgi:hypothetical protein